jgi:hypothetical protein
MTADEVVQYYVDLLILQYRRKPNARRTIAAFVREAVAGLLFLKLADAFNLETASGKQLDLLAKYIGLTRYYEGMEAPHDYFGFANYERLEPQNPNGFRDYEKEAVNSRAIWFQYGFKQYASSLLNDEDFRTLLKLKIINNTTDTTLPGIMSALRRLFGHAITLTDNADMTLAYTVNGSVIELPKSVLEKTLPRPAGTGVNVRIVRPFFSFSRYTPQNPKNPYATGFRRYGGQITGGAFATYQNYNS